MRVCLVRLPSSFLLRDRVFPPLGLMAVGTSLRLAGHDVTLWDGDMSLVQTDYDAYGMGPTTPEYSYALDVKDAVKRVNPAARMVIGGSFAGLNTQRVMGDGWDCVVTGDGEPVADRAFSGSESLIASSERPLDEYPIIDRTLINQSDYNYTLDGRKATTIVSSRGCPWKCGFCCKTTQRVRVRSAEHVAREIHYLRDEFGYQAIAFPDDIFIIHRSRTEAIAKHLQARGMIWRCLLRADLTLKYGAGFVKMMRDAGCVEVGMGIESGSEKILKAINKGETVATIRKAVHLLKDAGIRVKGFFILGLPGESHETLEETDRFLADTDLDDVDIKVFQPYPGSPIWENKASLDIDWHDMELAKQFYKGRFGEYHGNVRTTALTNEEIAAAMNFLEAKYKRVG